MLYRFPKLVTASLRYRPKTNASFQSTILSMLPLFGNGGEHKFSMPYPTGKSKEHIFPSFSYIITIKKKKREYGIAFD
jgi:hypothetical protein